MKGKGKKGINYMHYRVGDIIKVEIRDSTYRVIYKRRFRLNDKKAIIQLLEILEKFGNFSIAELMKERLGIGKWI